MEGGKRNKKHIQDPTPKTADAAVESVQHQHKPTAQHSTPPSPPPSPPTPTDY